MEMSVTSGEQLVVTLLKNANSNMSQRVKELTWEKWKQSTEESFGSHHQMKGTSNFNKLLNDNSLALLKGKKYVLHTDTKFKT